MPCARSPRAAATRASRVRLFCLMRPVSSYVTLIPLWYTMYHLHASRRKEDEMSTAISIVRADGEGARLWFYGGGIHTWLATTSETGGVFLLFDDVMTRGKTTPLHSHPVHETLYVLEGEILVHIDGKNHSVGPRGVAMVPR